MLTSEQGAQPALPAMAGPVTVAIVLAAIWQFLPELLLVNLELWSVLGLAVWATGNLLHLSATAFIILGSVFAALGLWLTYLIFWLSVANRQN